jgi:hypothetical protein
MTILTHFLRSLLLTAILSFIAPILIVGSLFLFLSVFACIPGLQGIIGDMLAQISHFLATFGTGSPINGLLIISLTWGFVGGLFDVYAFYRYQILHLDS